MDNKLYDMGYAEVIPKIEITFEQYQKICMGIMNKSMSIPDSLIEGRATLKGYEDYNIYRSMFRFSKVKNYNDIYTDIKERFKILDL